MGLTGFVPNNGVKGFSISVDTQNLETKLSGFELDQLPFATALALTRVGQLIKQAEINEMRKVFDRPTPYTLSAPFLKPATKSNLTAEVFLKTYASKGVPASVFLAPQVYGGQRNLKSSEKFLAKAGYLPSGDIAVPGSGATMNGYGNMSPGQIVQVISALQAFPETGYLANQSRRLGARKSTAPQFFVGKPAGGRLPLGVYMRTKTGVKPIMIFVKSPNYHPRLKFFDVASQTYQANFQHEFNAALYTALQSASITYKVA